MKSALVIIALAGALAYYFTQKDATSASFEASCVEINRNGYVPGIQTSIEVKAAGRDFLIEKYGPNTGPKGAFYMYNGSKFYEYSQYATNAISKTANVARYRFWNPNRLSKTEIGPGEIIAGRPTTKYKVSDGSRTVHIWVDSERGVLLQKAYFRDASDLNLSTALEVTTCHSISYQSIDQSFFTKEHLDSISS